jgi:hypothetical protein
MRRLPLVLSLGLLLIATPARADLLDVSALGANERTLSWAEGANWRDVTWTTTLRVGTITVDGLITSFTILPFLEILEGPIPETLLHFTVSWRPRGVDGTINKERAYSGVPITITFEGAESTPYALTNLGFATSTIGGQEILFSQYREQFNNPASAIRIGFWITEVEYTPNTVPTPEPATLALIGLGAAVLARRRHQG